MKLLLLGSGGYHPSDLRQTACLMLPSEGIVLDAGTAMFRVREHIETGTLDILLSHGHLDHVIGLTYLFDVLHGKDVERVTAHIESSKIKPVEEHLFADVLFPVTPPFDFSPVEELKTIGDCRITSFPMEHPGGSTGFRLDWPDRSLAYITDTIASTDADYVAHIKDVDLLIHECYFPDGLEEQAKLTGHSSATHVANVAKQSGATNLVLVHVNPIFNTEDPIGLDIIKDIFPNTRLGVDGMEIEF